VQNCLLNEWILVNFFFHIVHACVDLFYMYDKNLPCILPFFYQSDGCKIQSDGVPIRSGTLTGDLGGITIWNLWSNKSYANLEDSACTVRVLLFFPILKYKILIDFL
jgi:hypothetical protein